jgi:plastocyanin
MNASRRDLLEVAGAGLSASLAGCTGRDESGGTTTTTATPTSGATDATTTGEETASDTTADAQTATVVASNHEFDPLRLSVEPGTTVVWENRESGTYASHSVTSAKFHETATSWSFDEQLGKNESVSHTFEISGVYEYYCTIHGEGTMCGVVLVGDVSLSGTLPCESDGTSATEEGTTADEGTTTSGDGGYGDDY